MSVTRVLRAHCYYCEEVMEAEELQDFQRAGWMTLEYRPIGSAVDHQARTMDLCPEDFKKLDL